MDGRICEYINNDWRFKKIPDISAMSKLTAPYSDDSGWESIDLPHTWNAADCTGTTVTSREYSEGYYRGAGCYRKRVYLPHEQYHGRQIFIEFAGANTVAVLYVNGKKAGSHEGGYAGFRFDITRLVKVGTENILAVYVSNAPSDCIVPVGDTGDFTKMGGIYRSVRLISVPKLHIDLMDNGSCGVYITPQPHDGTADIHTRIRLTNDGTAGAQGVVRVSILDGTEVVAQQEADVIVPRRATAEVEISQVLSDPKLWCGVDSPFLYTMRIGVFSGGQLCDGITEQFGVRSFSFDSEKGFFLNGEHMELHGVNYHQDAPDSGWAMTGRQRERDYAIMRDMGCNAVRLAHYQHAAEEYALCDRLGLCVWTEIGLILRVCAEETAEPQVSETMLSNVTRQLTELICQTYNRPSVILIGLSNELYQMSDSVFDMYRNLYSLAKQLGGGRAVTFADAQFWGRFTELPADVVGYNRYFGWYKEAGEASLFGEWFDKAHQNTEKRPLCISEYGGGGALSQHRDNIDWHTDIDPRGERHYENYQAQLHEDIWAQIGGREYLWGKFVWCMFDFPSASRKEGDTSGINDKGLCTRDRVPKDAFWFYRSVWSGMKTCRIAERRFNERSAAVPRVKVYANALSAELFVNGESQGMGTHPNEVLNTVFVWRDVQLTAGQENQVSVKAFYSDGTVLEDRVAWIGK